MTRIMKGHVRADAEADSRASLSKAELTRLLVRFGGGLLAVLLMATLLGRAARPSCEAVARTLFSNHGYLSMAVGTLLADAFHFPVPPQFYMFMAIASHAPSWQALLAIVPASLSAGALGYGWARLLSTNARVLERTRGLRKLLARASARSGAQAALLASLLPVPFSLLCQLAGLSRLPAGFLLWACVYRVPKLLAFFGLIYLGFRPG